MKQNESKPEAEKGLESKLYPDSWPLDTQTLYPIALERYGKEYLEKAHSTSMHNAQRIKQSDTCLCMYCGIRFDPRETPPPLMKERSGDATGLCPNCGIDSLLCSIDGYPLTDPVFVAGIAELSFSGYCPICYGDPIKPIRWTPIEVD